MADGLSRRVPSSEIMDALLPELRRSLRDSEAGAMAAHCGTEYSLELLSLLSVRLLKEPGASRAVQDEAQNAFRRVQDLALEEDQFGEREELLCRFSFLAWRHSRSLGDANVANMWLERFERELLKGSVSLQCLEYFLDASSSGRSEELNTAFLLDAENLLGVCALLKERRNGDPSTVLSEAVSLFKWVDRNLLPSSFCDERSYFLSQFATTISVCWRWLGELDREDDWLRIAEQWNERTVEPRTGRAELCLMRLIRLHHGGELGAAIAEIPRLQSELLSLGMVTPLAKSDLFWGNCLKMIGDPKGSVVPLKRAIESPALEARPALRAHAFNILADSYAVLGDFDRSRVCSRSAWELLRCSGDHAALAHLQQTVGGRLLLEGRLLMAAQAFREARESYEILGLKSWAAYAGLLLAEVLLSLGEERQAADLVVDVLPTLDWRPNTVAAVALLRESIRRQKLDPKALRDVADYLRTHQ